MDKTIYRMASFPRIENNSSESCITTAGVYLDYLKSQGTFPDHPPPEVVIICYQRLSLEYILSRYNFQKGCGFSKLYLSEDKQIGVLGGFGVGSPAMIIKVEELIAWGVKKFIAIGTAGALTDDLPIGELTICLKALGEDGVSHLYLPNGEPFGAADQNLIREWEEFFKTHCPDHPKAKPIVSWSFSNVYRETHKDVLRVVEKGCQVVEMEAAALYAIGAEKNVQTLSLFVISDTLHSGKWTPRFKDLLVRTNANQLCDWALRFSALQINPVSTEPFSEMSKQS